MERGKFIVLEGQGLSGKTEQSPLLAEKLRACGLEVLETQEPGGVGPALAIRKELLDRRAAGTITPEEELGLFYKSRGFFLNELVIPALEKGIWVVSTRFSPSTYVYQGREGGISLDLIDRMEGEIVGKNEPDLCFLLDVEPEEIYRRRKKVEETKTRVLHGYNEMDMEKFILRRNAYLDLAKENRFGNWEIINGNGSINEVHRQIWGSVEKKFDLFTLVKRL